MTGSFPELAFEQLSTRNISTEMLLDTLKSYDKTTGLIYYSWFETHNQDDNNYLFDHIQEIITSFVHSPLFLLAPRICPTILSPEDIMFQWSPSAIHCYS